MSYTVDQVLAYAWAHSDQGENYIPASQRIRRDGQPLIHVADEVTVDRVRTALLTPLAQEEDSGGERYRYYADKAIEAEGYLADKELIANIRASAEAMNDCRFKENLLKLLAAGEVSRPSDISLLASLVSIYARGKEWSELVGPIPNRVAGFLAPEGEKVTNVKLTVLGVRFRDNYFGVSTFIVGITPEGYTVTWTASKEIDVAPGDKITIAYAIVKGHKIHNNIHQTNITQGHLA